MSLKSKFAISITTFSLANVSDVVLVVLGKNKNNKYPQSNTKKYNTYKLVKSNIKLNEFNNDKKLDDFCDTTLNFNSNICPLYMGAS